MCLAKGTGQWFVEKTMAEGEALELLLQLIDNKYFCKRSIRFVLVLILERVAA